MCNIMANKLNLTVVCDNYDGAEKGFKKSYGFSALIEINNKKILFDTATDGKVLLNNLKMCDIYPKDLDAVILSHNHYDHTDGLSEILNENKKIPVYIHKDWDAFASFGGFNVPKENRTVFKEVRDCRGLVGGIFLTNSLLASDYGGIHEQACFVDLDQDLLLITGCCHPGISAYLDERSELGLSEDKFLHIIGGFHGFKFSNKEAKEIEPKLRSIFCCHCTSYGETFKKQFGDKFYLAPVGKKLVFPHNNEV